MVTVRNAKCCVNWTITRPKYERVVHAVILTLSQQKVSNLTRSNFQLSEIQHCSGKHEKVVECVPIRPFNHKHCLTLWLNENQNFKLKKQLSDAKNGKVN